MCYGQVLCLPWAGQELWDWVDHIFWDVTPFSLVEICQRLEEIAASSTEYTMVKQWIPLKCVSVVPNCMASNSRHSNHLNMNHLYMFFPYHNKWACLNFSQAHFKELTSHFSTSSFICHFGGTDCRKWNTALWWISVHNYTKFGIWLITVI